MLLVPKFISYKPSNKKVNSLVTTSKTNMEKNIEKLATASLKYFNSDNLPVNVSDVSKVDVSTLHDEGFIDLLVDNGKKCDTNDSYAEVTRLDSDYLLKLNVKCDSTTDYKLLHVGQYDNCVNTLCVKDSDLYQEFHLNDTISSDTGNDDDIDIVDTDIVEQVVDNNIIKNDNKKEIRLTAFSSWSNYVKGSCDVKEVSCSAGDANCLQEVRVKKETEKVRYDREYLTQSLNLNYINTTTRQLCNNYNYVEIQGSLYRSVGNYLEVLNLNGTSTDSWEYLGRVLTTNTPDFGGYMYYKYVGMDFSSCNDTGCNPVRYIYDKYRFKKNIEKVTNNNNCTVSGVKVSSYQIVRKIEKASRSEIKDEVTCYVSTRSRKKY